MNQNKIIFRPKFKSFTNIFSVCLGVFYLAFSFWLLASLCLRYVKSDGVFDWSVFILLFVSLIMVCTFLFGPLGKKITICRNCIDYQNFFFFHHKIAVTSETKIRMGECYPNWGGRPELIWKISNRRGKEKIKIHADYFDYKKVNAEFEKLVGYEIKYTHSNIKF